MKSNLIDIACLIVHETAKAYLITDGGSGEHIDLLTGEVSSREKRVWVPKSLVEWDPDTKTMTMPEHLAADRGLI